MKMEKEKVATKELRQRKFLVVVPLLIVPFITLAFWAMGGGTGNQVSEKNQQPGKLKLEIPSAQLKEDGMNKMGYYERAERDSAKRQEQIRQDPYYQIIRRKDQEETSENFSDPVPPIDHPSSSDPVEEKINQKLETLNRVLSEPVAVEESQAEPTPFPDSPSAGVTSADIDRLEQMMGIMQSDVGEDVELKQLSGMFEQILDIQYPQRVQERLRERSEQRLGEVFAVSAWEMGTPVTSLAPEQDRIFIPNRQEQNGFYSLEADFEEQTAPNAIEAVVHETQTLVSGATVKLRVANDILINGVFIPADHFIYGTASVSGERLKIGIENIRYGASLFPVSLSVYDLDGLEGIHIPGAITRDVMKQDGDQSLQGIGMMSMDPSLGVQAASTGIEIGRNLLSKKVRLVRVQVKAGYQVLLMDEKQKRNF